MRESSPKLAERTGKLVGRAIQARVEGDGRPFIVGHLITQRCMCDCKSCLWKHNDYQDVPTEDIKRFYAQAAGEGFLATAFSGGEPFLRKDLGEIVSFVKQEADMAILLFTTGWFLEERMDEVLPHIDMLMLSLDSARPERHDEIRGLPGLFDRLMAAVEQVNQRYPDLSKQFNVCVQRGIAEEIDDLIAIATETGLQMSFDVITEFRHGQDGSHFSDTDMGLPLQELRGVCAYLLERKREGAPILNSELYFKYFMDGRPGYKCHLPKLAMCMVDGQGNVEDCLNLDRPIANIRDMPLKEIMELPRFKQLRVDAESCCSCSSPTMVDLSQFWENPKLVFEEGGIAIG
jgi:MoaA/NifB/PqqE/SkfB family radical SAM enzyme